jgi:hypothetical protein
MKKILIVAFVLVVVIGAFYFINTKDAVSPVVVTPPVVEEVKPVELCFMQKGKVNEQGFFDKFTLKMLIDNKEGKVSGELNLLPAEKDKKVGKFEGTVSEVDKVMMARTVDATWDTLAEGMNTKEQLKFIFGEGTASIGFGEMVDRGDGVYVYKDQSKILYNLQLTDVACTDLE